jgi:hypothetical protein
MGISNAMDRGKRGKEDKLQDALTIPDGAVIDLSAFDWGEDKLTRRQKLFVVWFCTPGTEYYHCAMKAARKAGYTSITAHTAAHKMRRDPKIDKLIKKFDDTIGSVNIIDTAQRWIQEKIIRGNYDIKDFYETVEYCNGKTGELYRKLVLKDLSELTPEQRLCIDGIDIKGQKGIMVYVLPDREKIRDSLITLMHKQGMNKDTGEGDEETLEIIMERLSIKKTIRQEKDEVGKTAGLVRAAKEPVQEL